jgi:hypothetical protein
LDHALTRSVPCTKSSGFPEHRFSRSAPAMEIRVASLLSSFGATGAGSTGHPAVSLFQIASPNVDSGFPAHPHPRVLPAFDFQVALNLESIRRYQRFSSSGFPRNSISPVAPLDASRVSPVFASSGPAGDQSSSYPDFRILQRLCRVGFGFPRHFAFPVAPADTGSRLPRFLHLPALPATDHRVTPNLPSFGASGA